MDLQEFTVLDEVGDEDAQVRNVDTHFKPSTAAEEIDYLNKILADIEKNAGSCKKYPGSGNNIEGQSLENNNSSDCNLLSDGNREGTVNMQQNSFENGSHDELKPNSHASAEKKCGCDFDEQGAGSDNENKYIFQVKRCISQGFDMPHADDDVTQGYHVSTSNTDSGLLQSGLSTEPNLMTADPVTKSDSNSTQNINACHSNRDADLGEDLEYNIGPISLAVLNESGSSELRPITTDGTTAVPINTSDCRSPVLESQHYSARDTSNNYLSGEDVSGLTDAKNSANDLKFDSVIPGNTGNPLENSQEPGFAIQSTESDLFQIKIDLALVKTEPVTVDPAEEFEFVGFMSDPAEDFRVKEEYKLEEEPTDFSSAIFDQSVDLFPVKIFKSEDEFQNEPHIVHSVRFLVEDKHYSREQVTSAHFISQSSLAPVIDMNMFQNVGKTTLALNLISLEDLIHSPSQVRLEDVEILSLFVKNYGSSFSEWKKIFKYKTNKRKLAGPRRRASKKNSPKRKKSRRTEACVKSLHLNEAGDSLYCNNDGSDSREKKYMEVLSNEKNKKKKKRRHKSHTKQNKQIAKTEENLVKENLDDIKLVALYQDNSCASTGLAKVSDFGGIQKQQVLPKEKDVEKMETESRHSQCDTSSIEDYEVEAKPVNKLVLKAEENWVKVDADDIKLKSYIKVFSQGNDNSCDSVGLGEESHCIGTQKQELHDQKNVHVQETNTESPSHCEVLLNDNFIKVEAKSDIITVPIISEEIIEDSVRKKYNSHQLMNAEAEKNLVKQNSDDIKLEAVLHHDTDKSCDSTGLDNGSECDKTQELHNQKDVQKTDTQSPSHCAILPNEGKFIRGEVKSGVSNMTISPQWTMDNSLTSNFLDVPVTEENILEKSGDMPCITQKHVEPPEKKAKKEIGRIILNDCKPCTVSLLDIAKDKKYKNIVEKYLKLLCKEIKSLTLPDLVKCEDKQIFACKSSDLPTSLRTDRALNIQLASKFTELDDHHKGEDENTMKSSSCSNRIVESEDEPVHVEEEEGYNMGSNSDHNIDKSVELVTANESESLKPGEEHTDYNQDSCNSLVQEEFEKEKVYGNEIFTAASEKRGDCDKDNIYYVDKSLKSEVETSVVGDENREEKIKTPKDAIDKELKLINKDKTQGKMESTREERDKLKRREKKKSKQERTFEINTKKEPEDFKRIKREKTRVTENKMYCHTKWKQEKIREKEKKLKELEQKRKFAVHHGFSKLETIENDSISKENVAAACTSLPSITTFKIPKKKVVETRGSDGDKQNLVLSRRKEILGPGKVSSYYSHKTSGNDDKNRSFSREWNSYRKIDNRNPNKNALETGVQTKQQIIEKWTKWEASHISGRNTVVRGSPAAACSFNDNPGYGLKRLQHMPQMEQKKKIPYQVSSSPVMDKQCMMSDYSAVRPEGRDLNMSNSLISENQKAQCKPERKPETNVLLNVPPPPIVDNWGMMPSRNDVEITDDILYAGEFSPAESSASPQESCHGIKEPEPLEKNIEPNVLSDNKNVSSDVREIKSSLAGNENAQKGPNDTNSTSVSGNKQIDNGTTVDKIRDVITVVNTVEERCRHLDKKQKMRLYEKVKRFYYEAKKRYHEEKGEKKQMKYVEYEKRKKEYYDLKIYLYEEKKREYEANKKNQKENLSKSRNVRQSSKPKEKGSKQILEPVSTLKTKTPQDNTEDIGCANSEKEDPYSPTGSPILLDPEFSDINVRASLLDQTLPFVKKPSFLEQSKQENEIKGTPADDSNELKHTSAPQTTGVNLSGSAPHKNYLPANGMSLGATSNSNITKLYDKVPGIPVLPSKSSVVVPPHDKSMPSASLFPSPLVQNALPLPVPPPQPSSSHSSFPPQPLSKFTSPVQNTQARLTVSTTSSFPNVCGAPVSPSVNTALLLPATPCDRVAAPSSPVVSLPSSSVDTVVPIPCSSAPSEATAQSSKMLSCRYKKSGPSDTPLVSTVIKKQQQLPVDLVPPPLPPDKLFALVGYNLAVSEGEQNSTLDDTLEVPMDIESDSEICNNEGNDTEYLATFGICVDNPSVNEPQVCQTHAANSNKTGKSLKKVLIKLMETTKEKKLVKSSHRNKKEHEQKQEVKEVISNASENSHASTATAGSQVIIPETSDSSNCLEINEEAVDASDIKVNIKETPKKLFCVDELLMSVEAADQQSELQVVFSNVQKSCSNKMLFRDEVPKYYQKTPLAQTLVDKCRGIPLVGLQYVLEVRQDVDMTLDGCYYICVICSKKMNTHTLIPHVKSVHHKLKFSEIHCRDIFLKYGSYSIKQWTAVLVKEFTIALSKVEAKMGRHKLAVAYEKDLSSVLTALKNKITEMSKLSKPVEKTVEEIGKDSQVKTSSCATGLSAESIPLPTNPKVSTIHKEIPLPSSPQGSTTHKEIPLPCSPKLSTINLEIPLPSTILSNKTTCISKDESPLSRNNPDKKAAGSLNFSADKKGTNMKERNNEQPYWKNDGEKVIPTNEKTTDIEKFSSKGQGFRKRNYRPGPNSGYRSPSQSPVRSPLPKRNNSRSPSSKRRRKSSSPVSKKTKRSRSSPPKEESMHVYTGSRKRRQSKSPISPSNSRSASHSKGLPTHHRSNSQSQSRYRSRSRSRSRHRSPYRRNDRRPQQSPLRSKEAPREQNKLTTEAKLKAFKDSETRLRAQHTNKQVLYDKQPEAHPDYNREWKIFWERRCGELEEKGIDAFSHDFKSEWAIFWRQRIKELMTNEFKSRRYSLLRKFNMDDPDLELRKNFDSHKTDTKVNSSWSPVRKDTASRIDRSPSPWEDERVSKSAKNPSPPKEVNNTQVDPPNTYEEEFSVIGTLKLLNELEDQLGSFGPAITILLDKAIEKTQNGGDAMDLFSDPDNFVLVRYAREKLSSQVSARILGVSVLVRTQMAVERAMWLQSEAEKFANKEKYLGLDITSIARATLGKDKIQVAQYIAQHLLNVGNSNASEEDLQNILIAVSATHAKIFIEQATKQAQDTPSNVSQPIYSSVSEPVHSSAAESVHNSVEPACTSVEPVCGSFTEPVCGSVADSPLREKPQKFSTLSDTSRSNKSLFPSAMSSNHTSSTSSGHDSSSKSLGLSMLQSAYEDETAKDMEKLSLEDLRSLLANFRSLSPEEQQALTTYLKKLEATDSNKVMKLREEMQKSAKSAGKKIMTPSNANNSQKQSNELSRDSVASKDIQHPVTNPPANRNAETISTRQTKSSMQNEPIIYNPLVKTGFSDSYPPENLHRAEPEREKPPTYQGSSKSPVGLTEAFREFESSHNQTADSQNRMSFVGRPCTARDGSSFTSSSRYAQQRFSESFDKDFYGSDYNKHFGQGGSHSSIPEGPEGLPRYNKPGVQDLPNYTPVHDRGYPSRGNQFQNNFNEQGEKNWYDGRPPPFGPPGQIQQSGYDNSHRKRPPLGGPHGPHVPFQQPW